MENLQERPFIRYLKNLRKRDGKYLNVFKDAYEGVVIIITTPIRIVTMTRELLRNGCFTIETHFNHDDMPFFIRTFIQPDGDIITILGVPFLSEIPLEELEVDDASSEALLAEYHKHNMKLKLAFEDLQDRKEFFGFVIDTSLIASNIYPFYDAFMSQTTESYFLAGIVATATLLFRQFARKFVVGQILKGLLFLAKKWFQSKISIKLENAFK